MTDTITAGTSTRYTTNTYLKVKKEGGGGVRGEREAGPRGEKKGKRDADRRAGRLTETECQGRREGEGKKESR